MTNCRRLVRGVAAIRAPLAFTSAAVIFAACGSTTGGSTFDAPGSTSDDAGSDGLGPPGPTGDDSGTPLGPFSDFGAAPVIDSADGGGGDTPANAADLFGAPSKGAKSGGPCLIEPEVGSLYPNNWLRPRFAWVAANGENLFELRVHAENQVNDLVVYTTQTRWTMPKVLWDGLRMHSADVPMTVSVRGGVAMAGSLTSEALGSSGAIGIAPVAAPGSVVYWSIVDAANSQVGKLKGFTIGDEGVVDVLAGPQVAERTNATCIGCHASTPDGLAVGFGVGPSNQPMSYTNSLASISTSGAGGAIPSYLTPDAQAAIDVLHGVPAYSRAHWSPGDRIELLSDTGDLHWVNLEGTGAQVTGVIPRGTLDTQNATVPTWSHDGATIVYTSAAGITDGRPADGPMDLFSVHYNNKAGNDAAPIPGASEPNLNEYYPAFSPDDKFITFDRIPGDQGSYDSPSAEVFFIPASGGTATRLDANDPPACTSTNSPGVTNSWPKFAPSAQTAGSRTFYWIIFSSKRSPNGRPQLYISPVVVDANGKVTTYHALYLWNQPENENNHTPAWDVFQIPPAPIK